MTEMRSRERILSTLAKKKTDRIPVMPFDSFEIQKMIDGADDLIFAAGERIVDFTNGWKRKDSRYRELVNFADDEGCDIIHRTTVPQLDRRFFLVPREFIDEEQVRVDEDTLLRKYRLRTPMGDLNYVEELRRDFSTTWIRQPLLGSMADVEKLLSIPYYFEKPDPKPFIRESEELGKRGVMCFFVSTPLVCVSHLFDFQTFLLWTVQEPGLTVHLIETVFERIWVQLEYMLECGVGPIIEFGGSEQATPPMMGPEAFEKYVVKYDGRLCDLVRKHAQLVRVHCHGRIRRALCEMMAMGVNMVNPVEAPPSGDVTLAEARQIVGEEMTLEGNVQYSDLELKESGEIDHLVRNAITDAGTNCFILEPTEWPVTYLTETQRQNYHQFITSGVEYGRLSH